MLHVLVGVGHSVLSTLAENFATRQRLDKVSPNVSDFVFFVGTS